MNDNKIPVTILTGYLGSGKTTLVNYIMKNTNKKIGVIVNEVGEIDIDGLLIEKNSEEIIKFSDKCMCCAVRGDIVDSVNNIIDKFNPNAILIETSGLAHPIPIAQSLKEDILIDKVKLDAIICVIDAVNFMSKKDEDPTILDQLDSADIIIITKTDISNTETLEEVKKYIEQIKPSTPIIISQNGNIDQNIIFDTNLYSQEFEDSDEEHSHKHFETKSIKIQHPLKKKNFVKFMDNLSSDIYRAKGIVMLDNKRYIFNKVGNHWDMEEWTNYIVESRLVFIGSSLSNLSDQLSILKV